MIVNAPISVGELIDKITILRIKSEQINDTSKLKNVTQELELLNDIKTNLNINSDNVDILEQQLYEVNRDPWTIEDTKRQCEREQNFGPGLGESQQKRARLPIINQEPPQLLHGR